MSTSFSSDSPPRADLVFRVGVVGHRPKRLKGADLSRLRVVIDGVLKSVRDAIDAFDASPPRRHLYSDELPALRAITPLAEGTDRIFAESALAQKFELCCPMPFLREEYAVDFLAHDATATEPAQLDTTQQFADLLDRARDETTLTTFELDGACEARPDAYAAAGSVVLNQSDLLVVVWDGKSSEDRGGTYPTLQAAFAYDLPIVLIHAASPHPWGIVFGPGDIVQMADGTSGPRHTGTAEQVREIVRGAITPPAPPPKDHDAHAEAEPDLREAYFAEHRPSWNFWFGWKLFRNVVGDGRFRGQRWRVAEFEHDINPPWPIEGEVPSDPEKTPGAAAHIEWWVNAKLRPHFAWADKLADVYADKYRTGYLTVFAFAAIAVILAMLPRVSPIFTEELFVVGELVVLVGIVSLVLVSRKRKWHERWLHYRLLAEFIRQIRTLIPLGGGRPFPHVPPHLGGYGEPSQTWMYWQMRAVARATGLPDAVVTRAYVADCLTSLKGVVESQRDFHNTTSRRAGTINHRLHTMALVLIVLTIAAVIMHLVVKEPSSLAAYFERHRVSLPGVLLFASAAFPAIGAAVAGIENQGEFQRVTKRSHATALSLDTMDAEIDALMQRLAVPTEIVRLSEVSPIATKLAQMMIDEVSDWRVVFIDRPQPAAG